MGLNSHRSTHGAYRKARCPQLKYWQTVYEMAMLLLHFVRSIRTLELFIDDKSSDVLFIHILELRLYVILLCDNIFIFKLY